MVTVAILGILTAIAVPNYRRYQSRARQSEAKINLASAYTAEQGFFGEYSSFTSCLAKIGADTAPTRTKTSSPIRYYWWGLVWIPSFSGVCGPAANKNCNYYTYDGPQGVSKCTSEWWKANAVATGGDFAFNHSDILTPLETMTKTTFTIPAVGSISVDPVYDKWTIDQNKSLLNVQPGI